MVAAILAGKAPVRQSKPGLAQKTVGAPATSAADTARVEPHPAVPWLSNEIASLCDGTLSVWRESESGDVDAVYASESAMVRTLERVGWLADKVSLALGGIALRGADPEAWMLTNIARGAPDGRKPAATSPTLDEGRQASMPTSERFSNSGSPTSADGGPAMREPERGAGEVRNGGADPCEARHKFLQLEVLVRGISEAAEDAGVSRIALMADAVADMASTTAERFDIAPLVSIAADSSTVSTTQHAAPAIDLREVEEGLESLGARFEELTAQLVCIRDWDHDPGQLECLVNATQRLSEAGQQRAGELVRQVMAVRCGHQATSGDVA